MAEKKREQKPRLVLHNDTDGAMVHGTLHVPAGHSVVRHPDGTEQVLTPEQREQAGL